LKNTEDLVDTMDDIVLSDDEMLVSFDVKSLFTSVPVAESIDICAHLLQNDSTLPERTSLSADTVVQLALQAAGRTSDGIAGISCDR